MTFTDLHTAVHDILYGPCLYCGQDHPPSASCEVLRRWRADVHASEVRAWMRVVNDPRRADLPEPVLPSLSRAG